MKKPLSKQIIVRGLIIGFGIFICTIKIPNQFYSAESLFCYTRDEKGNKALVKDNGAVFVEDVFVVEIPGKEWMDKEYATLTIILEDGNGMQKTKTLRLYEKEAEE